MDFSPQSSDSRRDINPQSSYVIYESNVAIPLTLATGYYSGSVSVSLPLDTQYANGVVEAWIRTQDGGGGSLVKYQPLTQTTTTAAGVLVSTGGLNIFAGSSNSLYNINFYYRTSTALLITPTIYYRIKSDRIQPSGMTFS